MQQGNISLIKEPMNLNVGYGEEIRNLYPGLFDDLNVLNEVDIPNKKTILLMNCDQQLSEMIKSCLSTDGYDVLNAVDASLTQDTIRSIDPLLLMLGIEEVNRDSLQLMTSIKSNPYMNNVSLVVISKTQLSVTAIDKLFSEGVTDFIFNSKEEDFIKRRIKTILQQVSLLDEYKRREKYIKKEKERLVNEFVQLLDKAKSKQRESLTHLELLIHTKELNEAIVNKINDLTPYLNVHGKAKLKQLTRQIKWELNEEQDLNLERKFDESNFHFYQLLQSECAELTRYEMRLCAYLKSNNGSAEIARITRKTPNCINVAFARIRSKLGINNNKELRKFLDNLQANPTTAYAYA